MIFNTHLPRKFAVSPETTPVYYSSPHSAFYGVFVHVFQFTGFVIRLSGTSLFDYVMVLLSRTSLVVVVAAKKTETEPSGEEQGELEG